jgi:putative holliday junction resolvase
LQVIVMISDRELSSEDAPAEDAAINSSSSIDELSTDPVECMIPRSGRLLGIDPGTVRIGLALCDANQTVASPLAIHRRRQNDLAADAVFFRKLVVDEKIVGLIVGLPISLNGTEGPKARETREFAQWLSDITGLPHDFQDERFTSHYANDLLDQMGAQVILHVWLETQALARSRSNVETNLDQN